MAGMIMFELDHDNKVNPVLTKFEAARFQEIFLPNWIINSTKKKFDLFQKLNTIQSCKELIT